MTIHDLAEFFLIISHLIETQKKLDQETGGQFNIFKILGMERLEVKTHSSFLREMLDPSGSHRMGSKFLELFLSQISSDPLLASIEDGARFDSKSALIRAEEYIGPINETYTKGGQIDLFLKDKNGRRIFIENKIDATDQKNQLLRYHAYDREAILIYLTLAGHEPSELSKGKAKDFPCILMSYSSDILLWLKDCRKEAVTKPVVREAITQYIELVRHLTNNTAGETMKEEIKKMLEKNPEYACAIEVAQESWHEIRQEVSKKFWEALKQPIKLDSLTENLSGRATIGEDSDGVYVSYFLLDDDKDVGGDDRTRVLYEQLQQIEPSLVKHANYIGWYNPRPFKRYMKFLDLGPKEIIDMHIDDSKIGQMAQKIIEQTREIWRRLIELQQMKRIGL